MFSALFAPVLAFAVAAPAEPGAPGGPNIVVQTQSVSRILGDARAWARVISGPNAERANKEFDEGLKRMFGEKGFEGLDINRPFAAYGVLAEDPLKSTAVVIIPIMGEDEFKEFLGRLKNNHLKLQAVDGKNGLFKWTDDDRPPPIPIFARFVNQNAYFSINDPDGASLDPEKLLAPEKFVDFADQSHITIRAFPERLPAKLILAPFEQLDAWRKNLQKELPAGGGVEHRPTFLGISEMVMIAPFALIAQRHVQSILTDGKEAALRLSLTPTSGMAAEVTVIPKPGTKLAASIAGVGPLTNRFAGIVPADPAAGLALTVPFSIPDFRDGALDLLKVAAKSKGESPAAIRPVIEELIKGIERTVKAGDVDFAIAMLAPKDKGASHVVAAIAFNDPSGLEKSIRTLATTLPAELKDSVKFDVEKVDGATLHTWKLGGLAQGLIKVFSNDSSICVATTPKAIYFAMGPDPIPHVKQALAAKPKAADYLISTANLNRMAKVVDSAGGAEEGAQFRRFMGDQDETMTILSISAKGGSEFRLRLEVNPRFLPRAMAVENVQVAPAAQPQIIIKQ